jgi:hypothetical protein
VQNQEMNDQEFQRYALSIFGRELGVEGLARFLRLYRSGTGDYTRDRNQWLANTSMEEIVEQIRLPDSLKTSQ